MARTSADLFEAIEAGDHQRVDRLLRDDPTLAGARDPSGVSALMRARYRADTRTIGLLRERIDELDVFEGAALGDVDRVRALVDAEASLVAARSGDGFTALHFAAFFGTSAVAALLIDRGADPDARGHGWMTGTALHSAASAGKLDIAQCLLDAGADPDARQSKGHTALHSAAHNGDAALVKLLLQRGADPLLANDEGRTALDFATETGDADTVNAIERALMSEG